MKDTTMSLGLLESLTMPDPSDILEREKMKAVQRYEFSAAMILNEFCRKSFEGWGFKKIMAEFTYTDGWVTIICIPIHSTENASTLLSKISLESNPAVHVIIVAKELKILQFCRESLGRVSEKMHFTLTDELFNPVRSIVGGSDTYCTLSKVKGYKVHTEFKAEVAVKVRQLLGEELSQKDILNILRLTRIRYHNQFVERADGLENVAQRGTAWR